MLRVCAWCNKAMGEIAPFDNMEITHGMCDECFDREMNAPIEETEQQLIVKSDKNIDWKKYIY